MSAEMPKPRRNHIPDTGNMAHESKMPEPFARISSVMGKVMLFDAPDFTMRKGDAVYTAAQMREYAQEATRQAMEACGKAVRAQMSTLSMHVTSRECTAYNDAVKDCDKAIRALTHESEKEKP